MLSFWQLFLKNRFRKRDLAFLHREIRGNADSFGMELEPGFETSVPVLDIPPPDVLEFPLQWALSEAPDYTVKRSFFEFLFGRPRIYVVDPMPGAMFGKPVLMAAFSGFGSKPRYLAWGQSYPVVNDDFVPLLIPEQTTAMVIQGSDAYLPFMGTVITGIPQGGFLAGPLRGPFPGDDRPNPDPYTPRPPVTTPAPVPGTAPPGTTGSRALFYGLCFQHRNFYENKVYPRPTDPMLPITLRTLMAFAQRSYRVAYAAAGVTGIPNGSSANSFEEMMQGLQSDISALNPPFGSVTGDHMVIFVGAHGFGAQWNPRNDVALLYQPGSAYAFVTLAEFFSRLAAIPEIVAHKDKVMLIMYACRSGRVWDGGIVPGELAGMPIITSTDSAGHLSFTGTFDGWLPGGLTDNGSGHLPNTWTELIDQLKWMGKTTIGTTPPGASHPVRPPQSGTAGGCRVQISLTSLSYTGQDVGSDWSFTSMASGNTSYQDHSGGNPIPVMPAGRQATTPIDPFNQGATHTPNPATPVYDRLWGPCAASNNVSLTIDLSGKQSQGTPSMGSGTLNVQFVCDNGTNVPIQTVTMSVLQGTTPPVTTTLEGSYSVQISCT